MMDTQTDSEKVKSKRKKDVKLEARISLTLLDCENVSEQSYIRLGEWNIFRARRYYCNIYIRNFYGNVSFVGSTKIVEGLVKPCWNESFKTKGIDRDSTIIIKLYNKIAIWSSIIGEGKLSLSNFNEPEKQQQIVISSCSKLKQVQFLIDVNTLP